jgi:hypothetical protein
MRTILLIAAAVAGLAAPAGAQNAALDGEWRWKMDSPQGEVGGKLILKTEGEKVSGSFWTDPERELKIASGEFKDGTLKVTVNRDRGGGGTMVYLMTGKLSAGKIIGEVSTDMDGQTVTLEWSATRP